MLSSAIDPKQLARLLAQGLGRVVPFVREHDATPYRAVITHACLHNTAYDPQVEGSRAPYMRDVIQATGEPVFYRPRILAALTTVTEYWDACQLFDFARLFAEGGDIEARQALYQKFARDDVEQRFTGAEALIILDGIPGFLAVARHIGAALRADPNIWEDDYLLGVARQHWGAAPVDRAFADACRTDPDIVSYRDALASTAAHRQAHRQRQQEAGILSYEAVAARIADQGRRAWSSALRTWSIRADDAAFRHAAADLPLQDDPGALVAYLRLFQQRPYPLDPAPLLDLARHDDDMVAGAAMIALRRVADPQIRALAFGIIDDRRTDAFRQGLALDLLASCFAPGDLERLAALLEGARDGDADDFHAVGAGALAVLAANPAPAGAGVLLTLYEHGPCSHCRERCVDLLHQLDRLPGDILAECRFDANTDLRAKAATYRAEPQPGAEGG